MPPSCGNICHACDPPWDVKIFNSIPVSLISNCISGFCMFPWKFIIMTRQNSPLQSIFRALPFRGPNLMNMMSCRDIVANVLVLRHRSEQVQTPVTLLRHFWTNTLGKGMKPLIHPSYGLNSTATVLLQGWLWYQITHEGWYAIINTVKKDDL